MDACFNSHALRQFENDEAAQERRATEAEDIALWQFSEECRNGNIARITQDYEIDWTPVVERIFKPPAHPDLNTGLVGELRRIANQCAHNYITNQIQKELDK